MSAQLVLVLIVVGVGALVQGSAGHGFSLIVAPVVALIYPEVLPATVQLLALLLVSLTAIREWGDIDATGFTWLIPGSLLGTLGGVGLLVLVPMDTLLTIFGVLLLTAVAVSFRAPDLKVKNKTKFAGGFVSGVMVSAVAVGGPPLALVYRSRPAPEIRSTLAFSFAMMIVMALVGQMIAGSIEVRHVVFALQLLPAMLLGLAGSMWAKKVLDERWLSPAILLLAGAAGVALILRSL